MAERVGCLAQGHTSSKRQNMSYLNDFSRYLSASPPLPPPPRGVASDWFLFPGQQPLGLSARDGPRATGEDYRWLVSVAPQAHGLSLYPTGIKQGKPHTATPPPLPTYLGFNYEIPLEVFSLNRNTEFSFPLLFLNKTFNFLLFHGLQIKCKV